MSLPTDCNLDGELILDHEQLLGDRVVDQGADTAASGFFSIWRHPATTYSRASRGGGRW